jgi:hypothetical protein
MNTSSDYLISEYQNLDIYGKPMPRDLSIDKKLLTAPALCRILCLESSKRS